MKIGSVLGLTLLLVLFSLGAFAQPVEEWNITFGGLGGDLGNAVQETTDGGYVIIGVTYSYGAGDGDVWLIKTNSDGNEEWNKTFGGPEYDSGKSVRETSDGGYIIVGRTESYGAGDSDLWLIKTDFEGNEEWNEMFGGPGIEGGWSVQETKDGDYIIAGETASYGAGGLDLWLIKTDSSGNKQWNKTFGGPDGDWGRSVQETRDGGYIIAGDTESYGAGSLDIWLIKTDSDGNMEWDTNFGGSSTDWCRSVLETKDCGYIIIGGTVSYGAGGSDVWLIKTDSKGNEEWNRTFGEPEQDIGPLGSELGNERGESVGETRDGGYIIVGATASYVPLLGELWVIKTDLYGNEEWNMTSGRQGTDEGNSVQETSDGGYIIAGDTTRGGAGGWDLWLVKIKRM